MNWRSEHNNETELPQLNREEFTGSQVFNHY